MIRGSKIDFSTKMEDKRVKQRPQNKEERKEVVSKGSQEVLNSASNVHLAEVARGAQDLNRVIESWPEGISFDRKSKDIAKDLLKGALDLQESLVMLGKLQEASQFMAKLKKTSKEKSGRVERAPRDCYDELREVIRESFGRQNLLPPTSHPIQRVSFENRELDLFPDVPSTSSSQSSIGRASFHRSKTAFDADLPSSSSSQSSVFQSQEMPSFSGSMPKVKEHKPKRPNLIAKLMGLEEFSPNPLQSTLQRDLEKDMVFNQRRPMFEMDLPKAKKPPVAKKVDPKCKTLEEIIETMQFKGLLKSSKFVDGPKHETCQQDVSGSPLIVIMKPRHSPEKLLQPERMNTSTSPCYEGSYTKEIVRKTRKEELSPNVSDRVLDTTHYRNVRAENSKIKKPIQEKGAKDQGGTTAIPNENPTKVHGRLSSVKTEASGPGKSRQQNNKEIVEKKIDKNQKVDHNLQKKEGMKNVKANDGAKSRDQTKLRKAEIVPPHASEKQNTQKKSRASNLASKTVTATASRNSRSRKNVKTDKPLVPKQFKDNEEKDGHINLTSNKEAHKTGNIVEAIEDLQIQEVCDVNENPITDDHISTFGSDESLPCESAMPSVICEGIGHLRNDEDHGRETVSFETLYSLIERDLLGKEVVNGGWDLGWSKGFSSDEMNSIVGDLEKHVFYGVIEDALAGFAF
ncbi:unnamed protein product [Cuscuta campestris]|uniref:DUF3741 domain-containing protein n=1 Tax=Cuscuta campestris TaxID=132261 RepID=A0A484KAR4_9ASTE|nr:unnamed protein product [Cuscuta campestris]